MDGKCGKLFGQKRKLRRKYQLQLHFGNLEAARLKIISKFREHDEIYNAKIYQ